MTLVKCLLVSYIFRLVQGTNCGTGSYWNYHTNSCSFCSSGTYQPSTDASSCLDCKKGTFSTGIGMKSSRDCKNCASGTYGVNTSYCAPCPHFATSPQGSFKNTECRAKSGYYAALGQHGVPCPANTFCPMGTTNPTHCPYGTESMPKSRECHQIWKELHTYNTIFGCGWVSLLLLSVGWLTFHSNKHAHDSIPHAEIQIKIAR